MEVIDSNRVYLKEGDIIPVFCACGHTYQPPAESLESRCPKCHRRNDHSEQGVMREMRN